MTDPTGPADAVQPHSVHWNRRAARVLVVDGDGRLLLMRGHDPVHPQVRFWFTVGGGLDDGETAVQAGLRELYEETGLRLGAEAVSGPVHEEVTEFGFAQYWIVQPQQFYVVRAESGWQPAPAALEAIELQTVDRWAWWTHRQLVAHARGEPHDGPGRPGEVVYPLVLPDLLAGVLRGRLS